MMHKIPAAVFCLDELKKYIAACEAQFGCDAKDIMVVPEQGGDWDHYVSDELS